MPDSLLRQIALVSDSSQIDPSDLAKVSAALQKQVTRDLIQFWDIKATVDTFPKLEDVPVGYWPIVVMDDIHTDGAEGVHEDDNGQPFALVKASGHIDEWSLTASHELIEMLVDPFGNRLIAGDSPKPDQGRVEILVEACDPSESQQYAYRVNGVLVSDFYSPRYFDPVASPGVRYSFTGAIQRPRDVLPGGYLSWHDLASDTWWQATWFDGREPTFRHLGPLSASNGAIRSQIDKLTTRLSSTARHAGGGLGRPMEDTMAATTSKAAGLRRQIEVLIDQTPDEAEGDAPQSRRAIGRRTQSAVATVNPGRRDIMGMRRAPSVRDLEH